MSRTKNLVHTEKPGKANTQSPRQRNEVHSCSPRNASNDVVLQPTDPLLSDGTGCLISQNLCF